MSVRSVVEMDRVEADIQSDEWDEQEAIGYQKYPFKRQRLFLPE